MKRIKKFLISILLIITVFITCKHSSPKVEWPQITQQTKPWTRWWWMGNIVNKKDLTIVMEEYQKAGLGGLEITPIYGVKGYEDKFINYLSPEWIDLFAFVLGEGKRLDLGIDMATGTGWPFGGPWVKADDVCKYVAYRIYKIKKGETLKDKIEYTQVPIIRSIGRKVDISEIKEPFANNKDLQGLALDQVRIEKKLPLIVLMAYSDKGDVLDLTANVDKEGKLNWSAQDNNWTLYAVFQGWHGKMVERAAPGGETNVIDHFSETALNNYLKKFEKSLESNNIQSLRAFFNDSYEVDDASGQANWTPDIIEEFEARRGYNLFNHLPSLFAQDTTEDCIRVLCDYRQTISELLLEKFTIPWNKWAKSKNAVTRNQSHGSPANILDLYAASDIPETEGIDMLRIKFASSAANVSGKQLTSSESATWLDEHFKASLADVKEAVDRYFLGGINHIVYHGSTFSPPDEKWPGWMFYASVHFGPTNSFWNDFHTLNNYVTRCQSFLQEGKPANDMLLYFPFFDRISQIGNELLQHFRGGAYGTSARPVGEKLLEKGYTFDFISDKQIKNVNFNKKMLQTGDASYQTIVLPECKFIPVETFEKLVDLAKDGAKIIIHKKLPADVPGFGQLKERQKKYQGLIKKLKFVNIEGSDISEAKICKGKILIGNDLDNLFTYANIKREILVDKGLHFIRRTLDGGDHYFIVNWSNKVFDGWVNLKTEAKSIAIFDPMLEKKGIAATRASEEGLNEVYLQLQPGESCILKTFIVPIEASKYPYLNIKGEPQEITGEWDISFITGGPTLPAEIKTGELGSWTNLGDDNTRIFSGTAKYQINFNMPEENADKWLLNIGRVCESAVITINDVEMFTLISAPYQIVVSKEMLKENNTLEIKVSNLMANRISYLDKQGANWKKFYNINFAPNKRENRDEDGLFNASKWSPLESGLIGPVSLTPIEFMGF